MKIYITGYASYEDWQKAGYPGAPSFAHPKTRAVKSAGPAGERAGLCLISTCSKVTKRAGNLCEEHYHLWLTSRQPMWMRPYVPLAER